MALLFMDSFDHYATADILPKWTGYSSAVWGINTTNGRHSSRSLRSSTAGSVLYKTVAASGAVAICGFGYRISALATTHKIIGFYDSIATKDQVYIQLNSNGSIAAYRGSASTGSTPNVGAGTLLGTSAVGVITAATYHHIETKVLLSDTVGTVTVNVNGVAALTLTTQDTSTGTLVWDTIWMHTNGGGNADWDDLWVCDSTGATPWNDFLGDARIDSVFPTGAGASTGWTPLSSTNVSNVDETTPDGDTTYNHTTTPTATDTFVVGDSPVPGATVLGVQSCVNIKKMDAGTGTFATVTRHSGTDYVGTTQALTTSYTYYFNLAQVNPGTSAAWTESNFNAAEFGYSRIA